MNLIIYALISIYTLGPACPDGVPYMPRSALAGAGFSKLEATPELPRGWNLYNFNGVSAPIPAQLANRIILIEDGDRIRNIFLMGEGPRILWSASISVTGEGHSPDGVALLRKAISEDIVHDQKLTKNECVEIVTALLFLDQISNESTTAAYDLSPAIALHGKQGFEEVAEVFWRNTNDELVIATWRLSQRDAGILGHFNSEAQNPGIDHPFQDLLDCIDHNPGKLCQDIELPNLSIEVRADWFQ